MPYEYRSLTPDQRTEIVLQRKARGYPLHAPPHPFRQSGYYLITAANYEHAEIMNSTERRDAFETRILGAFRDAGIEVAGWVILPNHYHILLGVEEFEVLPSILKRLHNGTSYEWNREDGETGKRRVWYSYFDRAIRSQPQYFQALNYIHYNPCKHGYVEDVYDWPWSSIFVYYQDFGRDWLNDNWKKYSPPKDFGEKWD